MEFHGVKKNSNKEAYCKHCNKTIHAVMWSAEVEGNEEDKNDLDYRIDKHISSFEHRENYFEYMEYNHNLVAYIKS